MDRWPIRRTLVLSNACRDLATLLLILALTWQALVAVVALRAVADSVFGPAKQAVLPALNQASKVAAPALGALLLLVMEPLGVFAIIAALSGLAAPVALKLPPLAPPAREETPNLQRALRAGFAAVATSPVLRGAFVLAVGSTFAAFTYDTQIPLLIREPGFPPTALGLCIPAVGAGGFLGSLRLWGIQGRPLALAGAASLGARAVFAPIESAGLFGVGWI